jgi:hypothetical protein
VQRICGLYEVLKAEISIEGEDRWKKIKRFWSKNFGRFSRSEKGYLRSHET